MVEHSPFELSRCRRLRSRGQCADRRRNNLVHAQLGKPKDFLQQLRRERGERETYGNVEADQFYVINQDSGRATSWKPTSTRNPIKSRNQPNPASSQVARIIPPFQLPLPTIDYIDTNTDVQRFTIEAPTLVTVWSSSCANCLREFGIWSRAAGEFREQGLDVVAINADLDATSAEIVQREAMLREMGFPFKSLTPTRETAQSIDFFQRGRSGRSFGSNARMRG